MILTHFNSTVLIYHLNESGGKSSYSESADITTKGMLQPMSNEDEAISEAQFAKGYKLFTPIVAATESDKVVVDSTEYRIKGIRKHNYGSNPHLELYIYLPQA